MRLQKAERKRVVKVRDPIREAAIRVLDSN